MATSLHLLKDQAVRVLIGSSFAIVDIFTLGRVHDSPSLSDENGSMSIKIEKSEQEWKQELSPEQYKVCRQKGTERAFTGEYWDTKDAGTYLCSACRTPLFSSSVKYDSGSGWPSFWEPLAAENVKEETDLSAGMKRVEVLCSACDSHLGHVFEDGPQPTGLRYCINSLSLSLMRED